MDNQTERTHPYKSLLSVLTAALLLILTTSSATAEDSVARQWNEVLLDSIRIDFPAPTVHSRNLYHTSAAIYDAWSVYDNTAQGKFYTDKHNAADEQSARNESISYAAYRVLSQRYSLAVDPVTSQHYFDTLMDDLGYDKNITTTQGNTPSAIGNRIAQTILDANIHDGSNENNGYIDNTNYSPVNVPMIVDHPSVTGPNGPPLSNLNHWQPLFIDSSTTQNNIPIGVDLQEYVGPHWGNVTTFALGKPTNPSPYNWSEIDPGPPPQFGSTEFAEHTLSMIRFSSGLDPSQGNGTQLINISPNTSGNRPLGTHNDQGYSLNPATNQPYADNLVKRADYARVLAEFWADGPASETPPGHWNVLANEVSDHPSLVKQIATSGPVVDDLEWDVKLGFSLNAAVHDSAVAAWGTKRQYDYVRPITMIRHMGSLGQSSDPNALASYDPNGLPLETDLVELMTAQSIALGGKHRNVYVNANRDNNGNFVEYYTEAQLVDKVAIFAWNHEPDNPQTEFSGCDWILAENWVPYQQDNFVTPAFAAYVSGHSTFSRAAAEVLSLFTGSEYFPEGLSEMTFTKDDFLDFELGPSETVTLQWAKYYDAADEAGISRLWGGIHVPPDDFAGRTMGSSIGINAYNLASLYFQGNYDPSVVDSTWNVDGSGTWSDENNWNPKQVPNGNRDTARFTDKISTAHTVVITEDVTVKQIEFENSNRYVVAGTGSINLNAATDDIASLTIHQGQHEFQAVVNVQANSDIMVENGSSLAFNNALNLNGNLVRKLGGGLLAINNVMHNDGGSVSVLDGTISGTGEIGGDLNNSTGTVAPGNNLSTLAAKGNVIRATKETLLMESSELTQSPTFSNVVIDFNTSTTVTGTNQEHAVPEPATGTGLLFGALGISVALRIRNACQPVTDSSIS